MSSARANLNILFVCTGNICRSPMADQILEQLAKKHNLPINVSSAGVAAMTGDPMTKESADAMAQRGYKPGAHKARDLTPELLTASDLVITMTLDHRSDIARTLPKASRYSFTLDEFARLAAFLMADPEFSEEFKKKTKETRAQYLGRAIKEAILLRGMVPTGEEPKDVMDPYGESIKVYTEVAEQIDEMLKVVVEFFSR
jgi:protein-tyrosine phosphatase